MTYELNSASPALTISISGKIDTNTAPELEDLLENSLEGITDLTMDFDQVTYISSAGLRAILSAHKKMAAKENGKLTLKHVSDPVKEVFDVTGFSSILNIE